MANFIELTSNRSQRPVLVNPDSVPWVSTREAAAGKLVTVIHFTAGLTVDAVSLTVNEDYQVVVKMMAS